MAKIEIESAFVEAWTKNQEQHPSWGMRTAEPHSRKNDAGKFETVSRTYRTVKVSRKSDIDLSEFVKGDRIQVWGTEQTEVREYEGKKFYDLIVWADRVESVESRSSHVPVQEQEAPVPHTAPATEQWPSDDVPF